jgi:hypothetical protein
MTPHRALFCTVVVLHLASGCMPIFLTPDDFPQPPWTPIVDFPTPPLPATPGPRPMAQPIYADDMDEARTFYLILKTGMAAGDSSLVAERIQYPIQVRLVGGSTTVIGSPEELERLYEEIFHPRFQELILASQEEDLALVPDGLQAADGALWLNLFCVDSACTQKEFRITQINN